MTNDGWAATWARRAGREIAEARKGRGMSAQAVADRCAELGFPILRGTLAKLENGRRETMGVHELVVIATALDMHPAALLFNAERQSDAVIEYLPGQDVPSSAALERFAGQPRSVLDLHTARAHARLTVSLISQAMNQSE